MEELKMVLATLEKLGGAGQWAFGWWLAKEFVIHVLDLGGILVVVVAIYRLVRYGIDRCNQEMLETQICALIDYSSYLSGDQKKRILKLVADNSQDLKERYQIKCPS